MGKSKIDSLLLVLLFFFCFSKAKTQNQWTLDKCIAHAIENNFSLVLNELAVQSAEMDKKQSKHNLLPSVNASATHGYNWGQSIDPFTNQFASSRVRTNNLSLNSNWILFNGLQNYHSTQKANAEVQYQYFGQEVEKRKVKMDVTACYLQILLNQNHLSNAEEQLAYTKAILSKTKKRVEAEKATNFDLLEINAQLALDSLEVTKKWTDLRLSVYQLKKTLNLPFSDSIEIVPDTNIIDWVAITSQTNSEDLPEILQLDQQKGINEMNLKIIQGKLYPRLSLNASLGSGYSGNNKELVGTDLISKPFRKQLDENFYQSATLSLNIPIFNKGNVSAELAKSKIAIEKTAVQRDQAIKNLQSEIEQLKFELENNEARKNAAELAYKATNEAFKIAQRKLEVGVISFADLLEIRKKNVEAHTQFVNAQFEYLFKARVLGYYFEE